MKKALLLFLSFTVCLGCSKKDDASSLFNRDSLTLHANETHQLIENSSDVNAISSNNFVASVSASGLVTANHVGTAKISAGNSVCNVTVEAKYYLYKEPLQNWGATKSEIQAKAGIPHSTTTTSLFYSQSASVALGYYFENNKLNGAAVLIKSASNTSILHFLAERYKLIMEDPDGEIVAMYINANMSDDATTAVGLSLYPYDTRYWYVGYIPASQSSKSGRIDMPLDIFKEFLNR